MPQPQILKNKYLSAYAFGLRARGCSRNSAVRILGIQTYCSEPSCTVAPVMCFSSHHILHLQLPNSLMYSAGHAKEMQNKSVCGFMPLIHMLWYLDKFVVDCGNIDALGVVDETPAIPVRIVVSDGRRKRFRKGP